jgi:hypothetical protein
VMARQLLQKKGLENGWVFLAGSGGVIVYG